MIAVDWGTSNARFVLCGEEGLPLDMREGPGAAASKGKFAEVFDQATLDWRAAHPGLPAYLCGMAGSAFGWLEAPYLPCPAELQELALSAVQIREGVRVIPGMRCTNRGASGATQASTIARPMTVTSAACSNAFSSSICHFSRNFCGPATNQP